MNKLFVYFSTKAKFLEATEGKEYDNTSIVFIADSKEIWNRGEFYATPIDFDIDDYATVESFEALQADVALKAVKADVDEELAKKADKTEIADMATKAWVGQQGFDTVTSVDAKIANAKSEIIGGAGEDYDTLKEIETWVSEHQDLYNALISTVGEKATKDELAEAVKDVVRAHEATDSVIYFKQAGISLSNTSSPVNDWGAAMFGFTSEQLKTNIVIGKTYKLTVGKSDSPTVCNAVAKAGTDSYSKYIVLSDGDATSRDTLETSNNSNFLLVVDGLQPSGGCSKNGFVSQFTNVIVKIEDESVETQDALLISASLLPMTQSTGSSTDLIMSQKAVTDSINSKANKDDVYTKSEVDAAIESAIESAVEWAEY